MGLTKAQKDTIRGMLADKQSVKTIPEHIRALGVATPARNLGRKKRCHGDDRDTVAVIYAAAASLCRAPARPPAYSARDFSLSGSTCAAAGSLCAHYYWVASRRACRIEGSRRWEQRVAEEDHASISRLPQTRGTLSRARRQCARAGARAGREAANAESAGAVLVGTGCRAALLPRGPNRPARLSIERHRARASVNLTKCSEAHYELTMSYAMSYAMSLATIS